MTNPNDNTWTARLVLLQTYVARDGHCLVPKTHVEANVKLGNWVVAQRQAHRNKKLAAVRKRALEAVPGWAWSVRGDSWEENFSLLERYVEAHAHTAKPIPEVKAIVNNVRLGVWARDQRVLFRENKLPAERVQSLESLPGWEWEMKRGRPSKRDQLLRMAAAAAAQEVHVATAPDSPDAEVDIDSCIFFKCMSHDWERTKGTRAYGPLLLRALEFRRPALIPKLRELDDDPFEAATPYDVSLEAFAVIMEEWDEPTT